MQRQGVMVAGSLVLLLLSALTWYVQPAGGFMLWAMQSLPLLLTLPGQWRDERRAQQWLGFILLFFMLASIMHAFNPLTNLRMLGIASLTVALAQFGLLLYRMKSGNPVPPAHKES
jgi:uncharacterized membrane protein